MSDLKLAEQLVMYVEVTTESVAVDVVSAAMPSLTGEPDRSDEDFDRPPSSGRTRPRGVLVAAAVVLIVGLIVGVVALASLVSTDEGEGGVVTTDSNSADQWARVPSDESVFGGPHEQWMFSVTEGGPGLVAVGKDGSFLGSDVAVWTSVDGLTWSRVPHDEEVFGGSGGRWVWSITAGGPGLVAVGTENDQHAAVWTSADGLAWSRVPHDEEVFGGGGVQVMMGVTAGGPGVVAVGTDRDTRQSRLAPTVDEVAAVWTSVDGVTWARVGHDEAVFGGGDGVSMRSVVAGGPGLVAVGSAGSDAAVWTSVDGLAWSRVPHDEEVFGGADGQSMVSVSAGGPGLVAVGLDRLGGDMGPVIHSDAVVWTSVDGFTWSRVAHDEEVFGGPGNPQMTDVASTALGLVAVGVEGPDDEARAVVWASVDGHTWARVADDEAVFEGPAVHWMSSVTSVGSNLVAVGSAGPDAESDAAVWVATDSG